jgi:hypothetical protein
LLPGIDDGAKLLRTACDYTQASGLWRDRIITTRILFSMSGIPMVIEEVETIQQLEKKTTLQSFPTAAEYLMDDQFVRLKSHDY